MHQHLIRWGTLCLLTLIFAACGQRQVIDVESAGPLEAPDPQYIVVFKKDSIKELSVSLNFQHTQSQLTEMLVDDLSIALAISPKRVFSKSIAGGVFQLKVEVVKALRGHPMVDYIEKDGRVTTSEIQIQAPWNLDRLDQEALPLNKEYNIPEGDNKVHAYVIDTGILVTHEEFGQRALHGFDFVDDDGDATDCNGHGTHVAGTLGGATYGVAKNVILHGIRVLDCRGSGQFSDVIAGIEWVTENHIQPAVANMSLGGPASQSIDDAIQASIDAGVTYVVAAGNSNRSACNSSPARVPDAISVGATTITDQRSSFSNFGSCVDIFAPGSDITSAWVDSDDDLNTIDGTSMASPLVAGVAALYLSQNGETLPSIVKTKLQDNGIQDTISNEGSGSPNLLISANFLLEDGNGGDDDGENRLESGVSILNLAGNHRDEDRYRVVVPEGALTLTLNIQGSGGDADLYVRLGQDPTLSRYDCRPYRATSRETCTFRNPTPGIYYIMLRAFREYSGVELVAIIE